MIRVPGQEPAPFGTHFHLEIIAFRKNSHAQQIETFSTGTEVIGLAGGILHGIIGREIVFKNQPLILLADSNPGVLDLQFGTDLPASHRNDDLPAVGCV